MLTGILFMGVFLIANSGITFLSVAFPTGLAFMIAGVVECLSYSSYRGDNEERTWILIDGTTTFMLGALIILNKLTADAVIPAVLGLWVITTGIRNFVRAWERIEERKHDFYDHLIIGLLNLVCGLYVFFDSDILNLQTMMMVGLCVVVQGINILHVGSTIIIQKPDFLKTKAEKLEAAAAKAAEAHVAAKEAIKAVKEAKAEVRVIEATPEEGYSFVSLTVNGGSAGYYGCAEAGYRRKRERGERQHVGSRSNADGQIILGNAVPFRRTADKLRINCG